MLFLHLLLKSTIIWTGIEQVISLRNHFTFSETFFVYTFKCTRVCVCVCVCVCVKYWLLVLFSFFHIIKPCFTQKLASSLSETREIAENKMEPNLPLKVSLLNAAKCLRVRKLNEYKTVIKRLRVLANWGDLLAIDPLWDSIIFPQYWDISYFPLHGFEKILSL